MRSQVFTDCLAQPSTLPCIRKSCGRQPSAEPTTSVRSIVGYTFSFIAVAQKRSVSLSISQEVAYAV